MRISRKVDVLTICLKQVQSTFFAKLLTVLFVALAGNFAAALDYPTKPVRLVVPYVAGAGIGDLTARILASGLSTLWGQQVIVDNKPGANEIIAAETVARAAPDGHTLLMSTDAALIYNPYLYKKLSYNPATDFSPISRVATANMAMAVTPSINVNSVLELIAYAKKDPGKLGYASTGIGGTTHLPMEWLKNNQGIDMVHIPYKGGVQALQDMLGGQVQLMISGPNILVPYAQAGSIGPAHVPPEILQKIAADMRKVIDSQPFKETVLDISGMKPTPETPAEFSAFMRSEAVLAADRVKKSGVSID